MGLGAERGKRGKGKKKKMRDFNNVAGRERLIFPVKNGKSLDLPNVKVCPLRSDLETQMALETRQRKLVGAIALHPLNQAGVDAATNTLVEGFTNLQRRGGHKNSIGKSGG